MADTKKTPLDDFITLGVQVDKVIGIWAPHIKLGVEAVKWLVARWNERQPTRGARAQLVELPPDEELIRLLRERADRIVATGEEFLNR